MKPTSKRNLAAVLLIALGLFSSCAALGRFGGAYDSFDQGLALFNQGRFAEAAPYFEDATRADPQFAQAYFYLGRAYISQSQWRAAIPPLRTAFRLAPHEAQQEIIDLILDATFAAAINDFNLGGERRPAPGLKHPL
jgi:tetratricopeptide (TPR) repeat protein